VGPMHSRARLNPPVVFGLKGVVGKVRSSRPSESGTRHFTPRRHTYTVRLRDKRYIRLIELIDANRKKTVTGKGGLEASPQNIDGETHHYTFIAAVCMLMPDFCANHPNDVRHRRSTSTGSHRHYLGNAVQVVVAREARFTRSRRYTHTVQLRICAETLGGAGREVRGI
jgi:hypothetical protein